MKDLEIIKSVVCLDIDFIHKPKCFCSLVIQPTKPIKQLTINSLVNIKSLLLNNNIADYQQKDGNLTITMDTSDLITLDIEYDFDLKWYGPYEKQGKSLQCQISAIKQQARWWLPCIDNIQDKYIFEFQITVPGNFTVICTGNLLGKNSVNDKVMFCYEMNTPISPNCIVISIGEYESSKFSYSKPIKNEDEDMPEIVAPSPARVEVFYLPKFKSSIHATCFYLPQALEFIEQWVGASYPFNCCKIVFGETTNCPITVGATVVIASVNLLITEHVIDHVFSTRFYLVQGLACQWFGQYINHETWADIWIIAGFTRFISYQFMRKMHGNNEVKFRIKKDMERVCVIDVKQPALCPINTHKVKDDILVGQHFSPFEDAFSTRAELMNLKSCLVMNMMEKRFGKGLLQKMANKILVTQMSGELTTGLGTLQFLKYARKVSGKLELKEFADQWIYGSGSPIFTTTYNFNRKKMVIELKIQQRSSNAGMVGATHKFTGPMVIRVQEPGGTFDTEIRVEEFIKIYDIIYHTKYKRIRRGAEKKKKKNLNGEEEYEEEEEEQREYGVEEGHDIIAEPDRITFEWIRLDPEGVWLCYKTFEQEDFMWNSILRQDKDVVAQYEAIQALAKIPSSATCATLTLLMKDLNFFYRLRMEAAYALINFNTAELENMGLVNLLKTLKENYCMDGADYLPKQNNFEDLQEYYMLQAVIYAISKFRDSRGWSPSKSRQALIDILRLNDNTNNSYTDSGLLSLLLDCIGNMFLARPKSADDIASNLLERSQIKETRVLRNEDVEELEFPIDLSNWSRFNSETVKNYFEDEDHDLLNICIKEIDRLLVRDRFAPSHQNSVTVTCLEVMIKWQIAGLMQPNLKLFLFYSRFGHFVSIREIAIEGLILLTGLNNPSILKYLAKLCLQDPDSVIRYYTSRALMSYVAMAIAQVDGGSQQGKRKRVLKDILQILTDSWGSEYEKMEYSVQKYLHKIVEMAKEFNPVAPKLKFKMPSIKVNATPSIVEESMSIDMPLILSPVDEVVNTPPPAPKPKKEKIKKEAVKIVEPPKQLNPVFDRARKVLKRLFAQKISFWFKEPVDPVALNLPTYTTIVKNPMDLGTVKKKLDNDEYGTEEEFAADVRLTFENSILFNPPGSQVAIDANILLLKFNREIAMTDFDGVKGFPENALHIIDKMLESEHSAIFRFPVDANLYPEYYQIITDPIDIQTITIKLNEGKYADLNEFHASVQLIFKNCFTFNKKGTFGHAAGTELQNLYQRLIKPYAKNITNFQPVKAKVTAKPKSTPVKASTPVKQPVATPHQIEHVVATPHQIEHVVATPHQIEHVVATPQQNERVVATPQQNERAVATPTPVIPVETPKVAFKPIKLKMKVRPPAAPTPTTTTEIIESTGTVFKPEESTTKNDAMEVDISEDVKQEKVEIVGSENPTETSQPVQTTEAPPPVTEPPKKLKLKFKLSSK